MFCLKKCVLLFNMFKIAIIVYKYLNDKINNLFMN